jgi:flavoprotein
MHVACKGCGESIRACEDFVASAARYFKLRLRTFTALDRSLLLETFAQGTFKDKQTSNYTCPWIVGDFHMLKRDRLLIYPARGTLEKLYSHQELERSEEYVWSRPLRFSTDWVGNE